MDGRVKKRTVVPEPGGLVRCERLRMAAHRAVASRCRRPAPRRPDRSMAAAPRARVEADCHQAVRASASV